MFFWNFFFYFIFIEGVYFAHVDNRNFYLFGKVGKYRFKKKEKSSFLKINKHSLYIIIKFFFFVLVIVYSWH